MVGIDNPPAILHQFMRGTHVELMKFLVGDHFEQVETAVSEIISNLKSKRCRLESQLPSPSDYATSIRSEQGICDHRFHSDLHVSLRVQAFGNFMTSMESEECIDSKYYQVASSYTYAKSDSCL